MHFKRFACAFLAILAFSEIVGAAVTVADFEDLAEGDGGTSLLDSASGILIHDVVSAIGNAVVENPGPPDLTTDYRNSSGNYVTSNGYIPGPGGSLASIQSLTIDLPQLAQNASLDLLYINTFDESSAVLTALDVTGQAVDTFTFNVSPRNFFVDQILRVTSANRNINSLLLTTVAGSAGSFGIGIDNVTFDALPEPSARFLMLSILILLLSRSLGRSRTRLI